MNASLFIANLIIMINIKKFMTSKIKDFLDKFFDLCREYQTDIPPHKMAEILRDYADRLDG